MNTTVHPRYANLPENVRNSEVMASKYAEEIMNTENPGDSDELHDIMQEWDTHFKKEGLIVSDKDIGVFGEVVMMIRKAENKELEGKLAIALTNALHGVTKQYMNSTMLLDRLESVATNLFSGVDELKKTSAALVKIVPRQKITPKRNKEPRLEVVSDNVNKEKIYLPGEINDQLTTKNLPVNDDDVMDTMGDTPLEPRYEQPGGTIRGNNMRTASDVETGMLDPGSEEAKRLRAAYKLHYSDEKFSSFSPPQQVALIEYYITYILGIKPEVWTQDVAIYHMLADLIDKERVILMCNEAKNNELTEEHIHYAVEEIEEAIIACNKAYGRYVPAIVIKDERSYLTITKKSDPNQASSSNMPP
ncbi:putative phosphoprotein [Zhuye pepper nucleorhabdovirus]|uniref:Phosphoprotein n=1 Tax=Zhuye pepper nucleorhabdovirus TaxID=2496274 RepID=A0A4V0NYL5_9RHAB|nr:putative phosphoprotein [Green Sichuan pepper nucleorhabdovirus]AZN18351.1 putative phosphoprotein [Zhuye pepper nucleorhabdovirus]